MKAYVCSKTLCELYGSCPISRLIPALEQSDPDGETGEILYFAACPENGETFCDLREDSLAEVPDMAAEKSDGIIVDNAKSQVNTDGVVDSVVTNESKRLIEHLKRCRWIFRALEEWRKQLKLELEDVRSKKRPFLNPPTVDWIAKYINAMVFGLKRKKDANGNRRDFISETRCGKNIVPITGRQVRWTLGLALGMTIDDMKKIYADWKERELKGENEVARGSKDKGDADNREENVVDGDREIDLAGGEHNWGGISDEDNSLSHLNSIVKVGGKPSIWMKKSTAAYEKLKKQIKDKPQYFDYGIFTYWVGLKLESFVRMPKQMNFRDVIGTVGTVEGIFERMERFRK